MNPLLSLGVCVTGPLIRLRALAFHDLPYTLAWRNDERSLRWFKSQEPLQFEAHEAWFQRYAAADTRDCMFFAETHDGMPVGQTSIYNFEPDSRRAELGRFLSAPDLRGRGLFREAMLLTLDWSFENLDLDELHLEVFATNERAIRLYRSAGFAESGASAGMLTMCISRTDYLGAGGSGGLGVIQ
jgi:diamine N-acetyltransferase